MVTQRLGAITLKQTSEHTKNTRLWCLKKLKDQNTFLQLQQEGPATTPSVWDCKGFSSFERSHELYDYKY